MSRSEAVHQGVWKMMKNNFLGGMAWAFGAIIGTALLLGILGVIGKNVNLVPVVGEFVSDVINYVIATNQNVQQ